MGIHKFRDTPVLVVVLSSPEDVHLVCGLRSSPVQQGK